MKERIDSNQHSGENSTSEQNVNKKSGLLYIDQFREKQKLSLDRYKKIGSTILNIFDVNSSQELNDEQPIYVENYATDYVLPELPSLQAFDGGLSAEENEKTTDDEPKRLLDARQVIDQLFALNQDVRLTSEGQTLVSSVDLSELNLPLKYKYENGELVAFRGERLGVEINKSSLFDSFRGHKADEYSEYQSKLLDKHVSGEISLAGFEVEQTEEQSAQINRIIAIVNNERELRGQTRRFIDSKIIHFFKKEAWSAAFSKIKGYIHNAHFFPSRGSIDMAEPESKIALLSHATHELVHADSYNAVKRKADGSIELSRIGFSMEKDGKNYFDCLNEAIVQERARRIMKKELENDPYYAEELAESKAIMARESNARYTRTLESGKRKIEGKLFAEDGALAVLETEDGEMKLFGDAYRDERQSFNKLVDKLAKYNHKTREETFEMFVDASTTGNYLPTARMVEKTFGKGSFRRLGEESSSSESFTKFTKNLGYMHITTKIKQVTKNIFGKISKLFGK